jgi:3-hydroxymyristoyl/3-hydroxydecanoyl-(acyl carrier protein) dehydratase/malonyl CoA-acyl carrier protein transacylase
VALVARDGGELARLAEAARSALLRDPTAPLPGAHAGLRERVFFSPAPLGATGEVAFVYPGSGNDFPGMGRDLALAWPGVLERQDAENERLASQYLPERFWSDAPGTPTVKERIFAQVAVGSLVTDVLLGLGVSPRAAIGYSLGESAALFALRAWPDRDVMWQRMNESPLFVSDLAGRLDAARAYWRVSSGAPVAWLSGIVERLPEEVREVCVGLERVYLQIVNAPRECVIGGEPAAVREAARRLGCALVPVPQTTTMHCPVVEAVAAAYREMHHLPTRPPDGVRFYSGGLGRPYDLTADTVADALLAQAVGTADFAAVIDAAYRNGARLFVEVGPGGSCTRMIAATLGDRPHRARAVCVPGADGPGSVLRVLALLASEGVPVDLEALYGGEETRAEDVGPCVVVPMGGEEFQLPARECSPPLRGGSSQDRRPAAGYSPDLAVQVRQAARTVEARGAAHAAFFRVTAARQQTLLGALAFQGALLEALAGRSPRNEDTKNLFLDRPGCLAFAVGRIGDVLGPDFGAIDDFPTRVRLPDEPLMLVDRILAVEGTPRSLTRGRVVTQHDVRPGAWYLDAGRIPTCITVEAGQADLFLSGYLGIDLRTRGLAVYRLLDAAVTFHRGLPGPGATIEYDIHIDQFFRQGDTHLFRFNFVGSVAGEPLLTMTDGCAGFFTAQELAAGKGVVQTELARRPRAGGLPEDEEFLPPVGVERYGEAQVDALRRGDLAGCFGDTFAGLSLRAPLPLPGGRMRLVHRVTGIDPKGGRYGIGIIRAEADVHPDDWFLTCHFIDDQVMPGTLMYECCLHTLRIFLTRRGWVGERDAVSWEPVPGVASRLKCRGQVTAATRVVTYEVTVKELGYRPEPYAIVDALMYADGKAIVDIADMSIRLSGQRREGLRAVWECSPPLRGGSSKHRRGAAGYTPLFGPDHILAFAVGKPSEAFGEPYRVFDAQRIIARLPGPPFSFLDRIVAVEGEPWKMEAGAGAEAEYDVPADAWYFAAARQPVMPFAVLLEAALQPCGWLAAYLGSALTSSSDLRFRNLGGDAELLRPVTPASGTLTTRARLERVSSSAGMIIQDFTFDLCDDHGPVYRGTTTFGFFSAEALAQQVGIRDATPFAAEQGQGENFDYPVAEPFPDEMLRMIDRIDLFVPDGGPARLGLVQGVKDVRPGEWFFKAHFYQDPVCPGSLGLESLLQLVQLAAVKRWGAEGRFVANVGRHRWTYRGQVVPTNRVVTVQAVVTAVDEAARELTVDGVLSVDGLAIYRMKDFRLRVEPG